MKVLMVINTTGLEYDDRLRKEVLSLRRLGFDVKVLAMEYANRAGQRVMCGDIPVRTIRLRSRGWFARSKGLWFKTPEMYMRFLRWILHSRPEVVWFHNIELVGLAPFLIAMRKTGLIRRLIWDQHELPSDRLLRSGAFLKLFAWLLYGCDYVVMANEQRRSLIREVLGDSLHVPIEVLNNYSDREFMNLPRRELALEVQRWLEGASYVLAQGGANPNRHLEELVDAVLRVDGLRLIVVGPYQQGQVDRLCERRGNELFDRVLFTGFVPQMDIVPYIDHALASVVFYETSITNSRLCAPNRLYQAICRGVPAIVSTNPPMQVLVEQYNCGLVVQPTSVSSIAQGLREIIGFYNVYRDQALSCSSAFVWEDQVDRIERLLRGLTKC